jgi:DNA polymerase III delta subunit
VGARDRATTLALSEAIFERDDRQRRDVAARMAGAVASHVGRLVTIKRLDEQGVGSKEAATQLRIHPFRAQKLYQQADSFSTAELGDALVRLAGLDGALKGQSRLAPDLEVQRALADLTHRPGGRE